MEYTIEIYREGKPAGMRRYTDEDEYVKAVVDYWHDDCNIVHVTIDRAVVHIYPAPVRGVMI